MNNVFAKESEEARFTHHHMAIKYILVRAEDFQFFWPLGQELAYKYIRKFASFL